MRQPNNSNPDPENLHRRIRYNRSLDKVVPPRINRSYAHSYNNGRKNPDSTNSPQLPHDFATPPPFANGINLNLKNDDMNFWARQSREGPEQKPEELKNIGGLWLNSNMASPGPPGRKNIFKK